MEDKTKFLLNIIPFVCIAIIGIAIGLLVNGNNESLKIILTTLPLGIAAVVLAATICGTGL